jgi:hypothetical protein
MENSSSTYPSVYATPMNILSRPIASMMTYPLGEDSENSIRSWIGVFLIILGVFLALVVDGNNKDL